MTRGPARTLTSALVLASVACGGNARAQPSAHDPIAAEAAFAQARTLMARDRFAEACPKLEASFTLDPALGTLLNLGDCYERLGRTASAWVRFRDAAAMAVQQNQRERETVARGRASALEPRLCRLVVHGSARSDLVVTRDGAPVARAALGIPVPVDPGAHTIEATAPGMTPFAMHVEVRPPSNGGECPETSVDIAELPSVAAPVASAPAAAVAPAPAPAAAAAPAPSSSAWHTSHTLAVVSAAGGLVASGLGAVFALDASTTKADANAQCTRAGCTAEGKALLAEAGASADLATVGFVAGAALLATGAVLWLTSPSLRSASTTARDLRGGFRF